MKYIRNKTINYIRNLQNNKIQRNKFGIYRFHHANMLQCFCQKLAFIYLICWKFCDKHLICIYYNNLINKPFLATKKSRRNTLYNVS